MGASGPFRHSVRFKLMLLMLVGVLILVAYFAVVAIVHGRQQQDLYNSRLESRKVIFDSFVKQASDPLETFAYDYTFWDDMVDFIAGDLGVEWGQENIDPGLNTFKTDVVWAYKIDGELVYGVAASEEEVQTPTIQPADPQDFGKIFTSNGVKHYFTKTEEGVFEIYAATVHPTVDDQRQTTPRGYYFVGKLLGDDYLKAAGKSIEGKAELIDDPGKIAGLETSFNERTGKVAFTRELKDFNDQTIGALYATYTAADLRDALIVQDRLTLLGVATIFGLTAILFFAIGRWVIYPLRSVQAALGTRSDLPVSRLKRHRDEFGEVARLIELSHWQHHELEHQKEIVEQKVVERTAQLKHEHARLESSINSLNAGFLMTNKDGRVAMYNPALLGMLESDHQTNGTPHQQQATVETLQKALEGLRLTSLINDCLANGEAFNIPELNYQGRVFSIYGAAIRPASGEIIGCVILMSDITERKIMERSKDEFFSIASHELRTPLTSIRGNSTMIMEYFPDLVKDETLKEMLGDIHDSSERLIGIVNDFLDVSSLEQGKMVFKTESFDISEVIENVVYDLQSVAKGKNLYLKYDKSTHNLTAVSADRNRTRQIIYNLIGNALKYTEQGGVEVKVTQADKLVKILVSDSGRGIPLDMQNLLFHKFQQASKSLLTRDTTKGTGLGLYISKKMAENMGGKIALEHSEEAKGSTFSLSLPLVTPAPPPQIDLKTT